jgi:phage gp29-like protein
LIEREVFGLQVARPFVDHNFGTEIDVPNFKFKAFSDPDLVALSTIVKTLCDVGFPIPPDWIEKAFGIPQAEDGEPSLGKSLPADTGNPLAGFPDVVSQEDEALTALSLDLFEAAGDPTGDDAVNVLRGQGKRSKVYARDLYGEGALSR